MTTDPTRLATAGVLLLVWLALIAFTLRRHRRRTAVTLPDATGDGSPEAAGAQPVLVAFASQSGTAERLARQTAEWLRAASLPVTLAPLGLLDAETLARFGQAAFVVSTSGDGDPPDNAVAFSASAMAGTAVLASLHYAVLALGDRAYPDFCGFGRQLDGWLRHQGARPGFERIEADNVDDSALDAWRQRLAVMLGLGHTVGSEARRAAPGSPSDLADIPRPRAPLTDALSDAPRSADFRPWFASARHQANAGNRDTPLWHVELQPADGQPLPPWQAGDLAQIRLANAADDLPREYSIASLPSDGSLQLLVRPRHRDDGSPGPVSHHLAHCPLGEPGGLLLRVRPQRAFSLAEQQQRPLILVGNGSGFAGLRAALKARARANARPNWLVFGERYPAYDTLYADEVEAWLASGLLSRVDRVFSRDAAQPEYVQDRLLKRAAIVREWVGQGSAIYLCGSLQGMAGAVDSVLASILGTQGMSDLRASGRYLRDVY